MSFVDDRLVQRCGRWPVIAPVEVRVVDKTFEHMSGAVVVVAGVLVTKVVSEAALVPVDRSVDGLGVRVKQKLVRIAPQAIGRIPRAVHAIPVVLAGPDRREINVPAVGVDLIQLDPGFAAVTIEQTQLDALGDLREQREVGSRAVIGGAQRIRPAGPGLYGVTHDWGNPLGWEIGERWRS